MFIRNKINMVLSCQWDGESGSRRLLLLFLIYYFLALTLFFQLLIFSDAYGCPSLRQLLMSKILTQIWSNYFIKINIKINMLMQNYFHNFNFNSICLSIAFSFPLFQFLQTKNCLKDFINFPSAQLWCGVNFILKIDYRLNLKMLNIAKKISSQRGHACNI